jgi:hypothetical protein
MAESTVKTIPAVTVQYSLQSVELCCIVSLSCSLSLLSLSFMLVLFRVCGIHDFCIQCLYLTVDGALVDECYSSLADIRMGPTIMFRSTVMLQL